jgi:hypothetical protein
MVQTLDRMPRISITILAAVLAFAAGSLLTSDLDAQPSPPVVMKVAEQNLDANAFIKVHEQGVATVTGTVNLGGGSVAVSNFPTALNVHPAPVVGAFAFSFNFASFGNLHEPFPTINATAIHLASAADILVAFQSPLSDLNYLLPNQLLEFQMGFDNPSSTVLETFTQPVPLNGMFIGCQESGGCSIRVSVIGTSQ